MADEAALGALLAEIDAELRPLRHERAVIVEPNGDVWSLDGEADFISFRQSSRNPPVGSLVTHNHPSNGPPSSGDYEFAVHYKVRTLRVVVRQGVYLVLPPASGWPHPVRVESVLREVQIAWHEWLRSSPGREATREQALAQRERMRLDALEAVGVGCTLSYT